MKQILPHNLKFLKFSCAALGLLITNPVFSQGEQLADSTSAAADTLQATYKPYELNASDFNKGLITSVEQAINGRLAGLRITPKSGAPGAPYTMETGHGNSLVGQNSPLIVIDGVLISYADVSANTGVLSFLNPEDVASISYLRDASAMALYGGKAVNGVLVIQTKAGKPKSKTQVRFNTTGAVSSLRRKADVYSGDEVRNLLQTKYPGQAHLAGSHNTDWQDAIYQHGYSLDNSLSLQGAIGSLPYRVSAGYLTQQGILKTSERQRKSMSLHLNPSLLQDHLTLDLSLLHSDQQLQVANEGAISQALGFDPTQPVHVENQHGGYFVYYNQNGTVNYDAPNPLSMLERRDARDQMATWFGQAHLRYKLHFLPSVKLNYRHAYHSSDSDFRISDNQATFVYNNQLLHTQENKMDRTYQEAFVDFDQQLNSINGLLHLTGGILKTDLMTRSEHIIRDGATNQAFQGKGSKLTETDLEYYGNLHVTMRDKYTAGLSGRRQLSSPTRISRDPYSAQSAGLRLGWNVAKESFLSQSTWLSHLNIGTSLGYFERLDNPNQYLILNSNQYAYAPGGDAEKTITKRVGLTYGLWSNRLQGTLSFYHNRSTDLLLAFSLPNAQGGATIGRTAGELKTSGLEASFLIKVIRNGDFYLDLGLNATQMNSKVVSFDEAPTQFHYIEPHNNYLVSELGRSVQSFYLFKQLYGPDGRPIQDYERIDGRVVKMVIDSPKPSLIGGLQASTGYGKWHAALYMRGNFGQKVYNYAEERRSWFYVGQNSSRLQNASRTYADTGFRQIQYQSDYFLEKGSFLRMDYLQVSYDAGSIAGNRANLKLHATAQNAFILTKYSGMDPEVRSGMDRGLTPQPRTFSLGLQLVI